MLLHQIQLHEYFICYVGHKNQNVEFKLSELDFILMELPGTTTILIFFSQTLPFSITIGQSFSSLAYQSFWFGTLTLFMSFYTAVPTIQCSCNRICLDISIVLPSSTQHFHQFLLKGLHWSFQSDWRHEFPERQLDVFEASSKSSNLFALLNKLNYKKNAKLNKKYQLYTATLVSSR